MTNTTNTNITDAQIETTSTQAAATNEQISTIAARAYNDTARQMASIGITLSHDQADDLGDEAIDWLRSRLGLAVRETSSGVVCTPSVVDASA